MPISVTCNSSMGASVDSCGGGPVSLNQIAGISGYATISYVTGLFSSSSSINGITGAAILTGIGGAQVSTSGQYVIISGGAGGVSTGYLTASDASGMFYSISNPSGFITAASTGNYSNIFFSKASGEILSGNLAATGSNLQGQINVINSITGGYITQFYPYTGNPSQFVTSGSADARYLQLANTGQFVTTGQTGIFATQTYVNNTSGSLDVRLGATGSTLIALNSSTSGALDSRLGSSGNNLQSQLNSLAAQSYVYRTGAQEISGLKTFLSGIDVKFGAFDSLNSVTRVLYDGVGVGSFEWGNRIGRDSVDVQSFNYENRILLDSAGAVTFNWNNKQLTGNWLTNTSPSLSGHLVNKGYLDSQTGGFTTLFYLTSNPSGYSSVRVTGSSAIGVPNFTGAGNVVVLLNGSTVIISGTGSAGSVETASNLGSGSGIFAQKVVNDIQLKSLKAGSGLGMTGSASELSIQVTGNYLEAGVTIDLDDPNADKLIFWQDNRTGFNWLSLSGGLQIVDSGINILVTGAGNITTYDSGSYKVISGAAGGAGNVTSVVGLTGVVLATGLGTVFTSVSGQTLVISGSGGGGASSTASNLGAGSGVWSQTVGSDLQFKSISAGTGLNITGGANQLSINLNRPVYLFKTGSYALTAADLTYPMVTVNVSGTGATTVTLPDAAGLGGYLFWIKNSCVSGSGALTVTGTAGQTFDEQTSFVISGTQFDAFGFQSTDSNYIIL